MSIPIGFLRQTSDGREWLARRIVRNSGMQTEHSSSSTSTAYTQRCQRPSLKPKGKLPVGLNLNDGFIVRLGTWSRTEDDVLIRTQSREVVREKIIRIDTCQTTTNGKVCSPVPEAALPGPLMTNTCRLEQPSSTHIADAIVCSGLTVFHPQHAIDLSDFPSIVQHLVEAQKSGFKPATR